MGRASLFQCSTWFALSLSVTSPALADVESDRFQVRGEIRPQARSDDGRFALDAKLQVVPQQTSADGRFVMKAINTPEAACNPLLDLFADGFEGL